MTIAEGRMHASSGVDKAAQNVVRHRRDRGGLPDVREQVRRAAQALDRVQLFYDHRCPGSGSNGILLRIVLRYHLTIPEAASSSRAEEPAHRSPPQHANQDRPVMYRNDLTGSTFSTVWHVPPDGRVLRLIRAEVL